jgi:hypothetical protein
MNLMTYVEDSPHQLNDQIAFMCIPGYNGSANTTIDDIEARNSSSIVE